MLNSLEKPDCFTHIDSIPSGLCFVDMMGRFINANKRFCELVGYSVQELQSKSFADITYVEDRDANLDALRELWNENIRSYQVEKRYIHKNGHIIWVGLTASLAKDSDGQPSHIITVLQDIGLRKRTEQALRESKNRLQTLFEQAPFSVQLLTKQGYTLQVNNQWKELWNASDEDVKNYVLKTYNVLEDPQLEALGITPYIKQAYAGKSVATPPVLYDPKKIGQIGRARWVVAYAHPIKDENEEVQEVMLIHHDVTERTEAESQLKEAKEAAESANRLKSSFLANMSHEIRTPLGAVLGFSELLKDETLPKEKRLEYLEIIDRSGKSLTQIIDDILDLSRVEAGSLRMDLEVTSAKDVIDEVITLLCMEAKRKNLDLSFKDRSNGSSVVNVDPVRLKQILINLVGNAIKFTLHGGITVELLPQNSTGQTTIAITDTGIGIAPENQSQLFRPFSQIDSSSTREFGGTGLGLALSKRLAQSMSGNLELFSSEKGKGSTFHLTIPTHFGKNEKFNSLPQLDSNILQGLNVLIVDDSKDNLILMEHILSKYGAQVESARNGKKAVVDSLERNFDLILMDIQMPIMDGLEAARELRRQCFEKPIIAVTAHAMKEEMMECLRIY